MLAREPIIPGTDRPFKVRPDNTSAYISTQYAIISNQYAYILPTELV